MIYMLDTNICIYIIKKKPQAVVKRFTSISTGDVCISSVTLSELAYGAQKSHHKEQNTNALSEFLLPLELMSYDTAAGFCYGEIRSYLEKQGKPIGPMDLMIAAHAKSIGATLVTNNAKEFMRVPGLNIDNWVRSS